MIKGQKKGALVWSSKSHGGPRGRLHIESKTYDVVFAAIDRQLFGSGDIKLQISRKGRYRYDPSERYKKMLANLHRQPMRRVTLDELNNL